MSKVKQVIKVFAVTLAISSCGNSHDSSPGPEERSSELASLEVPTLKWMAGGFSNGSRDIRWNARISGKGTTLLDLRDVKWDAVESAVTALRVAKGDTGEFEISAREQGQVLATNVGGGCGIRCCEETKVGDRVQKRCNDPF